jgi:hypothetical protein
MLSEMILLESTHSLGRAARWHRRIRAAVLWLVGRRVDPFRLRHAAALLLLAPILLPPHLSAQDAPQKRGSVKGAVKLADASLNGASTEGLLLQLKPASEGSPVLSTATDAEGNYEFKDVANGDYRLLFEKEGFEPLSIKLHVENGGSIVQDISLKLSSVSEKVEVKEQAEPVSPTTATTPKLSEKQLETLPLTESNFKEALPLTPGVVRTPDGKLTFRGSAEDQSMLQVNDSKMTDPVTGSFSIPVPLDAVQSVQVFKTPYSAENGGFSGALTEVDTIPPPESWRFNVKDLNVSLRGKNDHFVGIARATPRVAFGGPILKEKVTFSEVFEYDVIRDPIRGLPWPVDEVKRQGFTSFSTLQAVLSPKHLLTATLNVFPQRTQFANITPLLPQAASSDYDRKGESLSLSDVYSLSSGALFRLGLNYTWFNSGAHPQGFDDMLLTPESWEGNYFNSWARSSGQFEAAPTFQFRTWKFLGRHECKVGANITHRSFGGNSLSRDVNLLREDGTLSEQISFDGTGILSGAVTDAEEFVTDHWMITDRLAIDAGGRITTESIGRSAAFAPRFGIAYSPGKDQKTILRAGTGLFYAAVPLLAVDFAGNPMRVVSQFDPTGQILESQVDYQNAYIENGGGPPAERILRSPNSSPRSFVSSAEVDRTLWTGAALKVSYLHSSTSNLFVINPILETPVLGVPATPGILALSNTGTENYNEAEATLSFHPIKDSELNLSYVWSRSRGDLNTLGDLYVPFEQPVIRTDVYGIRPSDVPHRFVTWGRFHLPYSIMLGPILDVHTGYPYSRVDENQNYVGVPNSQRFPTFFSLDFQIYRDFRMPFFNKSGTHRFRFGGYTTNLTDHGNFSTIYNNVTSPLFGQLIGYQERKSAFILSVVN